MAMAMAICRTNAKTKTKRCHPMPLVRMSAFVYPLKLQDCEKVIDYDQLSTLGRTAA